jgi:nicotinamidase-related amidase
MPVTTLDPNTALIVVDLLKGIFDMLQPQQAEPIMRHASALTRAFRKRGLPVVLVTVAGAAPGRTETPPRMREFPPGWLDFIPELDQQPSDHTVVKRTWGAFVNTGLLEHLRDLGVTQVVIIGVSTSAGVESTARQAYELGFNVTLAVDAMTDLNPDTHTNSVQRIFPRLGETGSTDAILQLLEGAH